MSGLGAANPAHISVDEDLLKPCVMALGPANYTLVEVLNALFPSRRRTGGSGREPSPENRGTMRQITARTFALAVTDQNSY